MGPGRLAAGPASTEVTMLKLISGRGVLALACAGSRAPGQCLLVGRLRHRQRRRGGGRNDSSTAAAETPITVGVVCSCSGPFGARSRPAVTWPRRGRISGPTEGAP